jgi:hypothetical protein
MIKQLIKLPYEIGRLPLALAEGAMTKRLPEDSRPRVGLERALGTADRVAGAVLRNPEIAKRGADRLDTSQKLATAARLEREADLRREQARETRTEGRQQAEQKREAAQEHAVKGLEEADVTEARAKQEAKDRAKKAAASKKSAAAKKATAKKSAADSRAKAQTSTAEAKKKAARTKAKAELDDARETKQAADEARADADRLEELAEAKKQKRSNS